LRDRKALVVFVVVVAKREVTHQAIEIYCPPKHRSAYLISNHGAEVARGK
jgi:hypothetical protein